MIIRGRRSAPVTILRELPVWPSGNRNDLGYGGRAPSDWQFDAGDWWLEENGLIMEKPEFSMPRGKYLVTSRR